MGNVDPAGHICNGTPASVREATHKVMDACIVAAVQAAPVMFDKDARIKKALHLIHECAENEAELVVFPELFTPAAPTARPSASPQAALLCA